jgi:hypothetical protein
LSKLVPAWTDEQELKIYCYYENIHNFIPLNCIQWLEEYEYDLKFNASLPFHYQSARYVEAVEIYESSLAHFKSGGNNEGLS